MSIDPNLTPTQPLPIDKDLDACREELFAHVEAMQPGYAAQGWLPRVLNLGKGVVRGLLECWAWALHQLYVLLQTTLGQAFPSLAAGAWLELHCAQVDLARRPAVRAKGRVRFMRQVAQLGNVKIPAGTICKTPLDGAGEVYRYVTQADAVLSMGAQDVLVDVVAEAYGAAANATVGEISELATPILGIAGITNDADWLQEEGADAETDSQLRTRYFLKWREVDGCTKYAYQSWALSIPGVVAVKIRDQHPRGQGTVDVIVRGTAGLPTQELIEAVAAVVDREAPINDDVLVTGPTPVAVTIDCQLVCTGGDAVAIQAEAERRLRALFEDPTMVPGVRPLQIGDDLTLDRMVGVLMAIADVKRVAWAAPVQHVPVPEEGLAVLEGLTVAVVFEAS